MDELLQSPLFRGVLAVVVLVVLVGAVRKLLFRPKPVGLFEQVRCTKCGWRGSVGKYNRKCPQCASTAVR